MKASTVKASTVKGSRIPRKVPGARKNLDYSFFSRAARGAFGKYSNQQGKCHRTAELTASLSGGSGSDGLWPIDSSFRNRSLSAMKEAVARNLLCPGMVIYANRHPGSDPQSLDLKNGPHWFTYLGKDSRGIARFADQYKTNWTLEGLEAFIPGRKVDAFFDPHFKQRNEKKKPPTIDHLELSKKKPPFGG